MILGIDIGGTKVATGLVDDAGTIVATFREPMVVDGTAEDGLNAVRRAIDGLLQQQPALRVEGIGIVAPGTLDLINGCVLISPNLPCWRDFGLRDAIEKAYHLPAQLDNDANAAGLAEAIWGAGKGYSCVLGLTVGTGIGTAIIFDGKIYHGRTGAAGEGGHMTIDYHAPVNCGCGKRGCVEGLISGPSVARLAAQRIAGMHDGDGKLLKMARNADAMTSEMVLQAWREGDELAMRVIEELKVHMAIWLGNLIDLLEPDVFVVGGGFGTALIPIFPDVQRRVSQWSLNGRACEIPILPAKYGIESGIAGGAALLLQDVTQPLTR
jgi:glucokinase